MENDLLDSCLVSLLGYGMDLNLSVGKCVTRTHLSRYPGGLDHITGFGSSKDSRRVRRCFV
ncbi:hypothetical protein HanRHA438_Chr13g0588451 [Helianthus annuus]|uniref:Uncharacterized protein n=1 Tax=Helianthus annuus TaxID=4232 RepID=A0A9K3EG12_HELAN|nr:hypothetical protein HanXRQr2_Chr13g0577711 [Helianthus annuus]KAJ0480188.1 hypothetical protein HanIR_Chr13g0628681 [Helianthus annuus]KAJ0670459.1 hypothetical protein HanOQP8_Chr13g0474471 [Helianthus annuus]KAJ0848334.1 hypothetical protein HanPSC8_Chr13g0555991 [Helianthus annuus]KAJ0857299.1 hypothetical protein HanRHA438_Chr13g0588451 [Helianthus annuus]